VYQNHSDPICVWRAYVIRGMRRRHKQKSYTISNQSEQSDWNGFPEIRFEYDFKPHINVAWNGFVKIRFHVSFYRSHLLNVIWFQFDIHKNQIWSDNLNKAEMALASTVPIQDFKITQYLTSTSFTHTSLPHSTIHEFTALHLSKMLRAG